MLLAFAFQHPYCLLHEADHHDDHFHSMLFRSSNRPKSQKRLEQVTMRGFLGMTYMTPEKTC